jgi:hypothetical protein
MTKASSDLRETILDPPYLQGKNSRWAARNVKFQMRVRYWLMCRCSIFQLNEIEILLVKFTYLCAYEKNMKRKPCPKLFCLGSVTLSVLDIGHKVREFKPRRGDIFLKAIRIRSAPSFRGDVNPSAPCRKVLHHIKITCKYEQKYIERLISRSFRSFLLLAARELCW